ncbi:ankyrin repeat-containing domain protein [Aspergillus pseudoustus]|uniref:Ankyrin repeat-containing domain protein n=1 Tax=Aspergillus pseudoustus TaxID=1810923 RepID=A0ABR4JDZ2_9EURO
MLVERAAQSTQPNTSSSPDDSTLKLSLVQIVEAQESDDATTADIDIIHIIGVAPAERIPLETLIPSSDARTFRKREFVFQCDIPSLLLGDLSGLSIQHQALLLLRGLVSSEDDDKPVPRARILISYNLGALITKKAISIASREESQWPRVFISAMQFIFSNCFQRRRDLQSFDMKLLGFFRARKDSSRWVSHITPTTIRSLADALVETTEFFLSSRITLVSRVVSIYGRDTHTTTNVFDSFTGTLNISTEFVVPGDLETDSIFPGFDEMVCFKARNWAGDQKLASIWRILLSLVPPHSPVPFDNTLDVSHKVLASSPYRTWKAATRSQILYIQGQDREDSMRQAHQIALSWQADLRAEKKHHVPVISFRFSSRDPLRDSVEHAICTAIIQIISVFADDGDTDSINIIFDQYRIQRGWTIKDFLNILSFTSFYRFQTGGLLVLYDVDECKADSRSALWDFLRHDGEVSESFVKVVVTSRHKLGLSQDWDQSGLWTTYDTSTEPGEKELTEELLCRSQTDEYLSGINSRLLPRGQGDSQLEETLQRLVSEDQAQSKQILRLLEDHTCWPQEPSIGAFSRFCSLLLEIQRSSTVADVLDHILRSIPDQAGVRWVLCWLLYGYRPLSSYQIALLLCYGRLQEDQCEAQISAGFSPLQIDESLRLLRVWLSGLVHFGHDSAYIHDHIWDILSETDSKYIWNEVKPAAHSTMVNFLILYLPHATVRDRLSSIWERYLLAYNAADMHLVAPVPSEPKDILLYSVAAFGHILSKSSQAFHFLESLLSLSDDPLAMWAKVYWVISNPFCRPSIDTVDSTASVLVNMESLVPGLRTEIWNKLMASSSTSKEVLESNEMNRLCRAVQLGDEDTALKYARQLAPRYPTLYDGTSPEENALQMEKNPAPAWPSNLLWRASWLNMDRLAAILLETQSPDPVVDGSIILPSPLYMASHLGHYRIVQLLLKVGANTGVLRNKTYSVTYTAAGRGHSKCLRVLSTHDPNLLELRQPVPPIYQASVWGQWDAVKALLELGANPNSRESLDDWTPVVAAAESGYARTLQFLLQNKADPNTAGPGGVDTPLWFASVRAGSVECVQALLEHGADPNHELLSPPLLIELVRSSVLDIGKKIAILDVLVECARPIDINNVGSQRKTGLMYAASAGDIALVRWLLAHHVDLNATDSGDRSALMLAVENNQKHVVRELLRHGPKLNIQSDDGDTALILALDSDTEIVEMLLDADANPNIVNNYGSAAINLAVTSEKPEVVRLLVDRKADINHKDPADWAPIHDASSYVPNAEIVRFLAEGGADLKVTDSHGWTALHKAAGKGRGDILAVLLEFHTTINLEQCDDAGATPLHKAAGIGNLECVRRLLQAGADINSQDSDGLTVLMHAISSKIPTEKVAFLLSQPSLEIAPASIWYGAALHMACRFTDINVVTMLLDHDADAGQLVYCLWATPLISACLLLLYRKGGTRNEDLDKIDKIVRLLVDRGADVKAQSDTSVPNALCAAALGAGISTITYLINEGASLKQAGWLGRLPIHYAAANGIDNFQAVFLSDSDLSARDRADKSTLHWAAQFGHAQTVQRILAHARTAEERRKVINQADVDGWTALCWALRPTSTSSDSQIYSEPYDLTETVRVLLEKGADVSIKCRMGREDELFSPLELAKLHESDDQIIQMLEEATAHSSSGTQASRCVQPYKKTTHSCDVCLNFIWGAVWRCEICQSLEICKKCYGNILLYHGQLEQESGEPHTFKLLVHADPEIRETPSSSEPPAPNEVSAGDPLDDYIDEVFDNPAFDDGLSIVEP